ncbi:HAD family hydrolase [Frigidibacter sp. ROC022]|uniref:HAD family hydrolase n=1 Tax=Frigidibacter sp. ROC022 TaxID=2971796 RepID=UPI00215A86E4|nr:HAD family phosphatase [Frigidibacter sp. ROC022]MCR8726597.1 HAD family phosphatase [Frigidibacter sp. ROC022]
MTIDAVVFDIGNVLIEWMPEKYYDRVYGPERREKLFSDVDLHGMNMLVDLGHDFKDTIYGWAGTNPEYAQEITDWHDNWLELAQPVIHHSVRLMRALQRKGVPVFALSNFGVGSFELACTRYEFLTEFDRTYISGRLKLAKPDPAIYAHVEADCGIAPERLLFTDDRPQNTAAAEARGWKTHVFTEPDAWAERLVSEGLLTAGEAE